MNKGQGATVGAILLAGAMFRGGTTPGPTSPDTSKPQPAAVAAQKPATGEGPWLASCNYWASARWSEPSAKGKSPELHVRLDQTDTNFDSNITASTGTSKDDCDSVNWGIPSPEPRHELDIRAIVATVPDPIHSRLALDFDRAVDSLLLAAADNGYLASYYWLPWRPRAASLAASESTASPQTEQDSKREKQPGLIILKYAPAPGESDLSSTSYHRVIYLFLVAETPALGVNGTQLQNAFKAEALLQTHKAKLSMPASLLPADDEKQRLAIIGPIFSGSAASLHEGIIVAQHYLKTSKVLITGATGTRIAAQELDSKQDAHTYRSFGENAGFEEDRLLKSLEDSGYDLKRVASLSEDGSVFGKAPRAALKADLKRDKILSLRFPRELSLLRNAQIDQSRKAPAESSAPPSPYLNLSLKDYNADDTVPHFSPAQDPLSLEAQLMALAHQLQRAHTQFIMISASNILDSIFLAQFLHRACPDARLVLINAGDLLFARDIDNAPYVGSITVTPYVLTSLRFTSDQQRLYSDAQAESIYNAASYTFWNHKNDDLPTLAGYQRFSVDRKVPVEFFQAPLWATVIGSDGYYPLGILEWCASDVDQILPTIGAGQSGDRICTPPAIPNPKDGVPESIGRYSGISPALSWIILDVLVVGLCLLHCALLWSAQYWSPLTRDLAVRQNDQPCRRSVYLNIGTAVLVAMSFVIAYPLLRVGYFYHLASGMYLLVWVTLSAGILTLIATLSKTAPYLFQRHRLEYLLFNLVALLALFTVVVGWICICNSDNPRGPQSYVGLFFSYRCLHPFSGVSPLVPIVFLLFGWYLWSVCQTSRLRFSDMNRPRLSGSVRSDAPYQLFVSDEALNACDSPIHSCLYENITCLLITREIVRRFTRLPATALNVLLAAVYSTLFVLCLFRSHIQSLDHFLSWLIFGANLYEFLVAALFFPLIMIALSGWLRTILVWGALSRGLLEPLERLPVRFAFSRLKGASWMSMLRQSGLHIRWRDMGRTSESIRQLVHNPQLQSPPRLQLVLSVRYERLNCQIQRLLKRIQNPGTVIPRASLEFPAGQWDIADSKYSADLCLIYSIEKRYAMFCRSLLGHVLIPYWNKKRFGFVEELKHSSNPETAKAETGPVDPEYIRLAEELIVVRYVALIRAVLVNIHYLMLFVSAAFVLAIVAWNFYPFQPHAFINWCFTILLVFLGVGFIWVFAQMHRNPILSRITDTNPNELGWDFYLRILTFGAVPVLTWLAYQFPELGGSLFKVLQPGLQVMK
jgi:hypothetical protein